MAFPLKLEGKTMSAKKKLSDLAILDGKAAFDKKLYVGRPNIGKRQVLTDRINKAIDGRWLTNDGPLLQEFESRITEYLGVKHCVVTCNATIGLEIVVRALELTGEVIVPSMTFVATAHALRWLNLSPVFCDIDQDSLNIDAGLVEKMITPKTSGIIGVHLFGRPCDIEALEDITHRHNLKLIFDAAHAFGCSFNGQMIGNFGNAEVFSFHATKFLNSLEGGAIVTNDDDLAEKLRLMRNFGFSGYDNVVSVGTNGKMNEFSAAMGLTSFEAKEEIIEANYRNYRQYLSDLANLPGLNVLEYDEKEKSNYQYVVLQIDEEVTQITRDKLVEILWAENVIARRYFYPGCHKMEPYNSDFSDKKFSLPITEQVGRRLISLPTGLNMDSQKISKVCDIIQFCISHGEELQTLSNQATVS